MKLSDTLRAQKDALNTQRAVLQAELDAVTAAPQAEGRGLTPDETVKLDAALEALRAHDALTDELDERITKVLDAEAREDAARASQTTLTGLAVQNPEFTTVGAEERTYSRRGDRDGTGFFSDIFRAQFMGDGQAQQRLARHMQEERVERGPEFEERAVGTSAFAGLTVPQYLVDLVAPNAKAGRPFADACNHHDLPASGMTVNISKITTGSSVTVPPSENSAASETNMDDTLLTVSVQTASGQQTASRQALERGSGVESTLLDDLARAHATTIDSTLLNQVTNGLTNVATSVAYTDASPTAAELYPKVLQAHSAAEAVYLGMASVDLAVMHSRRWYWMQSQVSSSWPFIGQPGYPTQAGGMNLAETYGSGVRGILPNGTAVIVDNNIATNLGAGTNEDEIYVVSSQECHLWEDPNAPLFIRAEQPAAASLGVLFVVYSYFAYTFARYSSGPQKIGGTGLVTPTF